jgi:hypothetical protein
MPRLSNRVGAYSFVQYLDTTPLGHVTNIERDEVRRGA